MKPSKSKLNEPLSYWKTWLALLIILAATFSGFFVIWSLLFLFWIGMSIKNQELLFVERVCAKKAPFTFWFANTIWLVVSIYILWEFMEALPYL